MDPQLAGGDSTPKPLSFRDLAIVFFAVTGIILANVEVVRALDIALDAIHR